MSELKLEKPIVEKKADHAPFIQIEEPIIAVDYLEVKDKNPNYEYHWCLKSRMSEGRIGNWVVVDKKHPDFRNLKVNADHSPNSSYISYKDLVLCCARKETAVAMRKALAKKAEARSKAATENYEEKVGKVSRSLGDRKSALKLMKSIDKEE